MISQLLDAWLIFGRVHEVFSYHWCQEPVELQNRLGGGLFGRVFRSRRIVAAHGWTQFCDDACQASLHVWSCLGILISLSVSFSLGLFECDSQLLTRASPDLMPPACAAASCSRSARCVGACFVKAQSVVPHIVLWGSIFIAAPPGSSSSSSSAVSSFPPPSSSTTTTTATATTTTTTATTTTTTTATATATTTTTTTTTTMTTT